MDASFRSSAFWRRSATLLFMGVIAGCAGMNEAPRKHFAGGSIILPPGFVLREDHSSDTPVATGKLVNRKTNLQISYSCGSVFGVEPYPSVFADPARLERTNWDVLWSRSSGSGILYKITTLAKDRILKTEKLYISFPNAGPANFVAPISSKERIDEIESLVSTFRP